ncbi:MAG: hypothetical protein OXG88_01180 [Gammaproteobacteria bacterium]|nr:hypothetical protein [Gammaproteobacteria bacterium]
MNTTETETETETETDLQQRSDDELRFYLQSLEFTLGFISAATENGFTAIDEILEQVNEGMVKIVCELELRNERPKDELN